MSKVSASTLVPIGVLFAAIGATFGVVRWVESPQADIAALRARVAAVEARVDDLRGRVNQDDERWLKVLEDLSQIKQRLGIVETKEAAGKP
jgi:membrane protein implicated in regulation of membrane protease activity